MKRQTVVLKAPHTFLERTLWPEFVDIDMALTTYLDEITDKVIREEAWRGRRRRRGRRAKSHRRLSPPAAPDLRSLQSTP